MIIHVEKISYTLCLLVESHIWAMGAVKTMQALLSFAVRLQPHLTVILALKNNIATQPLLWNNLKDQNKTLRYSWPELY